MKTKLFISLFLLSFISTFSQDNNSTSKSTTKKMIGKWVETKIVGCLNADSAETIIAHDTIIFNKDKTYTWTKEDSKEVGKWKIENYESNEPTKEYFELLDLEAPDGTSNGAIIIYQLTKNSLILRIYNMVEKCSETNSIDLFFIKVK